MWGTVTLIDKKEKWVAPITNVGPKIVAIAAQDPKSIDEYVAEEERVLGYSAFYKKPSIDTHHIPDLLEVEELEKFPFLESVVPPETSRKIQMQHSRPRDIVFDLLLHKYGQTYGVLPPNSRAGYSRSEDVGGTFIVNMRKKKVTIKGHLLTVEEEPVYLEHNRLSAYRTGVVKSSFVLGYKWFPEQIFEGKSSIKKKDKRCFCLKEYTKRDTQGNTLVLTRIERDTKIKYTLPPSWSLVDGIMHRTY